MRLVALNGQTSSVCLVTCSCLAVLRVNQKIVVLSTFLVTQGSLAKWPLASFIGLWTFLFTYYI